MATTIWSPAPYIAKQDWLLQDGSIVTSPDFEATTSGRRLRITGTNVSVGSKQVTSLITASIDKVAANRGTTRWLRIFDLDREQGARASAAGLGGEVYKQAAALHINSTMEQFGSTVLLWDFEAAGLPLGATVFCILEQRASRLSVTTKIIWRDTNRSQNSEMPNVCVYDGGQIYMNGLYRYSKEFQTVEAMIAQTGGLLPGHTLATQNHTSQFRQAIVDYAARSKALDDLDEIALPDVRDPLNPTLLTFKRKASNYSASVHNELLALVQTGPLLERIKTSYQDLVGAMQQLGVVFTHKPGDTEFAKAAAGDLTTLAATVQPTEDNNDGIDHHHTVSIDFASGSVIVNCGHTTGMNEIAEAWDIAMFKADLTGETNILLEYAKAYKTPKEQARIRKILEQRTTPDTL